MEAKKDSKEDLFKWICDSIDQTILIRISSQYGFGFSQNVIGCLEILEYFVRYHTLLCLNLLLLLEVLFLIQLLIVRKSELNDELVSF